MLMKGDTCEEYLVGEGVAETEAISVEVSKVSTMWEVAKGVLKGKCIVLHIVLQNKKEAEE